MLSWTQREFARRIVNAFIRNGFIEKSQFDKCYNSLLKLIVRDEIDIYQCRELAHRVSRNSSDSVRNRTSKKLLLSISLIPGKRYAKIIENYNKKRA